MTHRKPNMQVGKCHHIDHLLEYPSSLSRICHTSDPMWHHYPFVQTRHTNEARSQPSTISTPILVYTSTQDMGEVNIDILLHILFPPI